MNFYSLLCFDHSIFFLDQFLQKRKITIILKSNIQSLKLDFQIFSIGSNQEQQIVSNSLNSSSHSPQEYCSIRIVKRNIVFNRTKSAEIEMKISLHSTNQIKQINQKFHCFSRAHIFQFNDQIHSFSSNSLIQTNRNDDSKNSQHFVQDNVDISPTNQNSKSFQDFNLL
jgi:hypothetical protein